MRLHRQAAFPLVEYDLAGPMRYIENVAGLAVRFGLGPNLASLKAFVDDHLQHCTGSEEPVPVGCREIYAYLRENRFQLTGSPDEGFVRSLLQLVEQGGYRQPWPAPEWMSSVVRNLRPWMRPLARLRIRAGGAFQR